MDRWIEHLVEPRRLILAWQPPRTQRERARWAVGDLRQTGHGASFRYFHGTEFAALNAGRSEEQLLDAGFAGYPAFVWTRTGPGRAFQDGALAAFLRRVPSARREDFPRYLERFRVRPREDLSPFTLLAVTGAALPSDGFTLVDPLEGRTANRDVVLEIMGYHYNACEGRRIEIGASVHLVSEPTSTHDPNAVRVEQRGELLGYVHRLQAKAVSDWLAGQSIQAWGARENGSPDEPRAFMFVAVRERVLEPA